MMPLSTLTRRPIPRRAAFDIYWRFAAERHSIFEQRVAGRMGPWTVDPILSRYKFCNVFRAADRVSQHLIREVCYPDVAQDPEDLIFQIVLSRTFSKPSTWESLVSQLGRAPALEDLRSGELEGALSAIRESGAKLYTGAFILCATDAYGRKLKHLNHVEMFRHMFVETNGGRRMRDAQSMEELYLVLHSYPLMGDFMSYQIAIDLNYSALFEFSEDDFTQPGPGAQRGIQKVFEDTAGWRAPDLIKWMVDKQESEFEARGLAFHGLFGRRIHAIDAQNLFCETDKYCREALPELKSARTRIKASFSADLRPIELFFPPKWGLQYGQQVMLAS